MLRNRHTTPSTKFEITSRSNPEISYSVPADTSESAWRKFEQEALGMLVIVRRGEWDVSKQVGGAAK